MTEEWPIPEEQNVFLLNVPAELATPDGLLGCRSCPSPWRYPATHIGNAYGSRHEEGSSWDWPLCSEHVQWAMVAGFFPIRKVDEDPPFDPTAYIRGEPVTQRKSLD